MNFLKSLYSSMSQIGIPISLIIYAIIGYFFILISNHDIGVIPWVLNYFDITGDKVIPWQDASKILGTTVITSGLATTILRTNFFTNILQKQLFKVVYSDDLLKNRKDIIDIWSRVSKTLYSNRFPDVADAINNTVTKKYFPIEKHYYYHKTEDSLKIEVIDKPNKWVKLTQTLCGEIRIHRDFLSRINPWDTSSEIRAFGYLQRHPVTNQDKTDVTVTDGKFNDKVLQVDMKKNTEPDSPNFRFEYTFNISSIKEDKIKFEYTIEKIYHLLNPLDIISSLSRNLHYDYTLYVNYNPSDIQIRFIDVGTADNFHDVNKNSPHGLIAKKNDGVIFPGQGYNLVLQIIN